MQQWQFYFELVPSGVSYYQALGRASLQIVNPGLSYPTVNQGLTSAVQAQQYRRASLARTALMLAKRGSLLPSIK
jgi:hypothetical protein